MFGTDITLVVVPTDPVYGNNVPLMKLTGLWLHTEFRKLWGGQGISLIGHRVMFFALQLTAVVVLEATPFQMGIVIAMQGVPAIFGIFLGAWSDRRRRLPIIIGVDVGRSLLLLVIPFAYLLDVLTIELLYFVAFGIGSMSMLFQIAYRSLLPSVVEREELVEANSKLELATSGSVAIGPAIGGVLVQAFAAPFALIFSSFSFAISAVLFRWMKIDERRMLADEGPGSSGGAIRDGLRYFRSNKLLIGIAFSTINVVLFWSVAGAVWTLYFIRELEINPGLLGVIFAMGSIGLVFGSVITSRYAAKFGVGRLMAIGLLVNAVGAITVPLIAGPMFVIVSVVIVAQIAVDAGIVMFNIQMVSLRQAITPDHLQGRLTSIFVVLSRVSLPIGGLLGGVLGETIGLRNTLFVAAIGIGVAAGWLIYFGVWRVHSLPAIATVEN